MSNKKKIKKESKKTTIKNLIFIFIVIFIIGIIFILSNNTNKKDNNGLFYFNTSEFSNITAIGLPEYQASLNYEYKSIIFICSNESEDCYNTLNNLNSVGKDKNISIEYLNVLELVEEEKNELLQLLPDFEEKEYPYLVVINEKESTIYKDYLEKSHIEEILKDNKIS